MFYIRNSGREVPVIYQANKNFCDFIQWIKGWWEDRKKGMSAGSYSVMTVSRY